MDIFGETDIGMVRDVNQDNFSYEKLSDDFCFAFVCDGMGGANGGNVASEIATEVLLDNFSRNLKLDLSACQISDVVGSSLNLVNEKILNYSNSNENFFGMGTTVVGLVLLEDFLHIFNVGDSRAYLFNENGLVQLTVDHSYVQTLVDCGRITPDEARVHPRKNEITKAVGISEKIEFDFKTLKVKKNDYLFLCSDGLTNVCSEAEISNVLQLRKGVKQTVARLIDCANSKGGFDNVTVVLIRI